MRLRRKKVEITCKNDFRGGGAINQHTGEGSGNRKEKPSWVIGKTKDVALRGRADRRKQKAPVDDKSQSAQKNKKIEVKTRWQSDP